LRKHYAGKHGWINYRERASEANTLRHRNRSRRKAVYLDGDQRAERSITASGFFTSYFLAI
jgi:hypothetical protein